MISGQTFIVAIGVENYASKKQFSKVRYATNDANGFVKAISLSEPNLNTKLLTNDLATRTIILKEIDSVSKRAIEQDRILIFFAGHGRYSNEQNYIVPYDGYKTEASKTCISIINLLTVLKSSRCKRVILFLDCCHSRFVPGELERETNTGFEIGDLAYLFKDEEYICGFAACKEDEISNSDDKLKNGIWTSFLIKALLGQAPPKTYEDGYLFTDKLQSYLNKEVKEYVQMNTADRRIQTPSLFGSFTDRFPIANLSIVFDQQEISKDLDSLSLKSVSMHSTYTGKIVKLSGFIRGRHTVPKENSHYAESFITKVAKSEIKEEIESISNQLKKLNYKRKQKEVFVNEGAGSISTPDFLYSVIIQQSTEDPSDYVMIRQMEGLKNSKIIDNSEFNEIFSNHFDELRFQIGNKIDIEALIDRVEDLDNENIDVVYDDADLSYCVLKISGIAEEILVRSDSISITYYIKTSPRNLALAFKESYKAISNTKELQLLS